MTRRFRIRFRKQGELRWLSHLELSRAWLRILRRAALPVKYSQGFSPHPKMAFSPALAVGVAGIEEYMDVVFDDDVGSEADLIDRINSCAPKGLPAVSAEEISSDAPSIGASVKFVDWRLAAAGGWEGLKNDWVSLIVERLTSEVFKATKENDVKFECLLNDELLGQDRVILLRLPIEIKIQAVVESLNNVIGRAPERVLIERLAQWVQKDGELRDPITVCRAGHD